MICLLFLSSLPADLGTRAPTLMRATPTVVIANLQRLAVGVRALQTRLRPEIGACPRQAENPSDFLRQLVQPGVDEWRVIMRHIAPPMISMAHTARVNARPHNIPAQTLSLIRSSCASRSAPSDASMFYRPNSFAIAARIRLQPGSFPPPPAGASS